MLWTALTDTVLPYILVIGVAYSLGVMTGLSQAPDPTEAPEPHASRNDVAAPFPSELPTERAIRVYREAQDRAAVEALLQSLSRG